VPGCNINNEDCPNEPAPTSVSVSPAMACSIYPGRGLRRLALRHHHHTECLSLCNRVDCELDGTYETALFAAAGVGPDGSVRATYGGADAGTVCPSWRGTSPSPDRCQGGRWTADAAELAWPAVLGAGPHFAGCAYFEAVSVHAFDRLARELEAHGAPGALVRDARRAAEEEAEHTRTMADLARRFGASPSAPSRGDLGVRSLFEVALENGVEGCVRESFAAVLSLVRAERTTLGEARPALRQLARDACGHARLSWRIAAWALPRLTADERAAIVSRMREASRTLAAHEGCMTEGALEASGTPDDDAVRRLARTFDRRLFGPRTGGRRPGRVTNRDRSGRKGVTADGATAIVTWSELVHEQQQVVVLRMDPATGAERARTTFPVHHRPNDYNPAAVVQVQGAHVYVIAGPVDEGHVYVDLYSLRPADLVTEQHVVVPSNTSSPGMVGWGDRLVIWNGMGLTDFSSDLRELRRRPGDLDTPGAPIGFDIEPSSGAVFTDRGYYAQFAEELHAHYSGVEGQNAIWNAGTPVVVSSGEWGWDPRITWVDLSIPPDQR